MHQRLTVDITSELVDVLSALTRLTRRHVHRIEVGTTMTKTYQMA